MLTKSVRLLSFVSAILLAQGCIFTQGYSAFWFNAKSETLTVDEGQTLSVVLAAETKNEQEFSFEVTQGPRHGTLSGSAPDLTYTPDEGFSGDDRIQFIAKNAKNGVQSYGNVYIKVRPVEDHLHCYSDTESLHVIAQVQPTAFQSGDLNPVTVRVNVLGDGPRALVLSSYKPVQWKIYNDQGISITQVMHTSWQTVYNVDPMKVFEGEELTAFQSDLTRDSVEKFVSRVEEIMDLSVSSFHTFTDETVINLRPCESNTN